VIAFGDPGMATSVSDLLKEQQRPFDRWRGGMGLSLPIAHRIVEVHRGTLWGLPGSRATFALALRSPPRKTAQRAFCAINAAPSARCVDV